MKRADILRQLKKGDVVVNPWVSKEFNGKYNPNYATVYLGNGKFFDCNGRIVEWCLDTKVNRHDENEPERVWRVIGNINLKDAIKSFVEKDTRQNPYE